MYRFADLTKAYGESPIKGAIKSANDDFKVDEIMPVEPSGSGEHLWLHIEKNGANTDWVAKQLAQNAEVKAMAVSYAGLKDRHAVTRQWFSIHLPGRDDPDLSVIESDEIKILSSSRHDRKLKRGALSGNRFQLRVRNITGPIDQLEARLEQIAQQGVPNYFGEQRFGFDMANLARAKIMFQGKMRRLKKTQRSIYLSAARSWIFNQLLSRRIQLHNWDTPIAGDVFMLAGKSACFADDGSSDIAARINAGEINVTGALWGEGESLAELECFKLEQEIADENDALAQGLCDARMKQERRALKLNVKNLRWQIEREGVLLNFELPAGAYATMVMREILV
ncbi:MAG: tRNA pseudouridine(13) synthase TruD [Gammaproteobacteria bacterium]|nr:tRNA pseudouridine(13) synthase TruD [Gammaproteobacteria bacterium]